ncbi:MAG TPA: ABC transporter permease [Ktedonobacteraceae bacterium]|nr:ABC transporter permease [Ktedonobacteraceae bacterium]
MNTLLPSSLSTHEATPRKHRVLVVSTAFWHALRRDITTTINWLLPFLLQVLILPFSLLFVFGKILPEVGVTQQLYPAIFFPGVVALTIFMASLQGASVALMLDLGENREIDDRLLAPMPLSLLALEKVVFSTMRSLVAAGLTFLLGYIVLGSNYQVRVDDLWLTLTLLLLYALSSASFGLVVGTLLPVDKIYLLFSLIFSAILYTGCVYYTWTSISTIKALQVISLFNPLTYAAEGLRSTMVPIEHGKAVSTLPIGVAITGLIASFLISLALGIWLFRRRVIS